MTNYKELLKKRYKYFGSYKSDRWIANGVMLLIFFWLWFVAQAYDYNIDYYSCTSVNDYVEIDIELCENPFYTSENAWKGQQFLDPGEYGNKPGILFNSAGLVVIGLLSFALLLNHYVHNRGRK